MIVHAPATSKALALLFWLAAPFWETKDPAQWSGSELDRMVTASPWARNDGAQVYLASARPVREAEDRLRLRSARRRAGPEEAPGELDDYRLYLKENPGKHMIVAVRLPRPSELNDAAESRRMEEECVLKAGRKKYKITGHFPPTDADPYLRLLYPRVVDASMKSFSLELYLPSVERPYRMVEFFTREMTYRGKLEY